MSILGIDLGYYQVKTYDGNKKNSFVSVVGSPDVSRIQALASDTDKVIEVNGSKYLVGQSAVDKSRMRHRREDRDWIDSEEYRVLFYRALAGFPAGKYQVVTGLPNDFYSDAPRLKEALSGVQEFVFNGMPVRYEIEASVIMQPFGALACMAFDDFGNVSDQSFFELTGVIDIGGKTTNILTASNFADISAQTMSKNIGGWDIIRAVRAKMQEAFPKSNLSDHQIAEAIISGEFYEFGKAVNISDLLDDVLPMMAEDVIGKASSLWGSGANLRRVLVTGGGAQMLSRYIEKAFPHTVVVADPVFANAVGYFRYGKAVSR